MKRVLVVISENHYRLYGKGLEYFNSIHSDVQLDIFLVEAPKRSLFDMVSYVFGKGKKGSKWIKTIQKQLEEKMEAYQSVLFFNNIFYEWSIVNDSICKMLMSKDSRIVFVDSIKTLNVDQELLNCFKKIYSLEHQDINYAKNEFGVNLDYVFIGTNYNLYNFSHSDISYDVTFVGISNPKRLKYLDSIAEYCFHNNLKLFVSGHFWHDNNFLNWYVGRFRFKRQHPLLFRYIHNQFITPEELANVYNQSKICLNINVDYHASFNPRIFDVMYVGKLMITDIQMMDSIELVNSSDFVMCSDKKQMIAMIDKYLNDDEARNSIAKSGMEKVREKYLFINTLDIVLK